MPYYFFCKIREKEIEELENSFLEAVIEIGDLCKKSEIWEELGKKMNQGVSIHSRRGEGGKIFNVKNWKDIHEDFGGNLGKDYQKY